MSALDHHSNGRLHSWKPYSLVGSRLQTQLSYATLHAAIMCIPGSKSSHYQSGYEHDLTLVAVEGKIS